MLTEKQKEDRDQRVADGALIAAYRSATRMAEDILGHVPPDVHQRATAALAAATVKAKVRDLDVEVARAVVAAVLREECAR